MSTASSSCPSTTASTPAGDAAVTMSKPSPLSSRRSASRTSTWSSAMSTRERIVPLFVTQDDHRVDPGGGARRNERRGGGGQRQQQADGAVGERVGGGHARDQRR